MFDPSAPHIIILLIVVLLLFGSTRLPGAAQALGKSLHIFRRSVKGLEDEKDAAPQAPARRSARRPGSSPPCPTAPRRRATGRGPPPAPPTSRPGRAARPAPAAAAAGRARSRRR